MTKNEMEKTNNEISFQLRGSTLGKKTTDIYVFMLEGKEEAIVIQSIFIRWSSPNIKIYFNINRNDKAYGLNKAVERYSKGIHRSIDKVKLLKIEKFKNLEEIYKKYEGSHVFGDDYILIGTDPEELKKMKFINVHLLVVDDLRREFERVVVIRIL